MQAVSAYDPVTMIAVLGGARDDPNDVSNN
jgi:hypothetical protein